MYLSSLGGFQVFILLYNKFYNLALLSSSFRTRSIRAVFRYLSFLIFFDAYISVLGFYVPTDDLTSVIAVLLGTFLELLRI